MSNRRSYAAWAALVVVFVTPPARSQESAPDGNVEARDAFRAGSVLARGGQWSEALAAFERSSRLRPHAITTFNIGYCERALGHATRARHFFRRARAEHAARGGAELSPQQDSEVDDYLREIDAKLAHAIVTLSEGAVLSIDGRPLDRDADAGTPPRFVAGTREHGPAEAVDARRVEILLDPGPHVVLIGAAGEPDRLVTRTFAAGEVAAIDWSSPPAADRVAAAPPASGVRRSKTPATVALVTGGVGLAVGAGFGVAALLRKSSLDEQCPRDHGECPPSARGDISALRRDAALSTAGFVVAVAGGAAYLVLTRRDRPAVAPAIGAGSVALVGSF